MQGTSGDLDMSNGYCVMGRPINHGHVSNGKDVGHLFNMEKNLNSLMDFSNSSTDDLPTDSNKATDEVLHKKPKFDLEKLYTHRSRPAYGDHRSSKAIVIRKSLPSFSESAESDDSKDEDYIYVNAYVLDNPEIAFIQFFQAYSTYDLIPLNSKLVVLDSNLPVSKAFYALIYNGVRSGILWDGTQLCGILSVTDYINIVLLMYQTSPTTIIQDLEHHLISDWIETLRKSQNLKPLTFLLGSDSLYKAIRMLVDTRYHRIPILAESDEKNPLYLLTPKRILRFLYLFIDDLPQPTFMHKRIRNLGIGTYNDLLTVYPDTPLIQCLTLLVSRNLSSLPVITHDNIVVDIYARFDAIEIATQCAYQQLPRPISEMLEQRRSSQWYKGVATCLESNSLRSVMDKLLASEVHGLVVVDDFNRLKGVITLYDILKFLTTHPMLQGALQHKSADAFDIKF